MPSEQGFAGVEGTRLYYQALGEGAPIVLLHGFSIDHRMWDAQVAALSAAHRVVRYDLRGFGQSPPPNAPYANADDLKALLDHLGIARAVILGLSMGGGVAINFTLAYPEATRALIVAGSTLPGHQWGPAFTASLEAVSNTARDYGVEAARRLWLEHPLFSSVQRHPDAAASTAAMVGDYSGWHWLHRDPARSLKPPARDRLESIAAPTLVLIGEHEPSEFQAVAQELARRIPNARRAVLAGCGHMTNMEDPETFNRLVLDFTATLDGGSPPG